MIQIQREDVTEKLVDFFHHCHRKQYSAKSIMIRPGDPADTLYYLKEGSVVISVENEEGDELIITYLNQGDFIGEIGLFSDTGVRNVTVRTRTPCVTEEISYQQIKTLSETQLKSCYPQLLETLSGQLARRLLSTSRKASDLVFLDVAGRVESVLHELAAQPDARTHPDGMQIKITRQEISRMVGCSREMVGRVLKELEEQDIVWTHGKTMVVYDEYYHENKKKDVD